MTSDDTELEELLGNLDIGAYLDREGIDYRETYGSRGQQYNLKSCPACGTSKWKVFLNVETGLGNCFSGGCSKRTFNKFSFIREHISAESNRAVIEHIKQFALEQGWRPPRKAKVAVAVEMEKSSLKMPHSYPIPIKGRNLAYLQNRNIPTSVSEYFHWSYCHKGLFAYKDNYGNQRYQDFSERILIPVFDLDGELVSFQGRDITGAAERKYLFPNGYASTGVHLYNGHNVQKATRVVVGEGAFDVAALKIAMDSAKDLRDVVPIGTFGKHISVGAGAQLDKFRELQRRGVQSVTIMWDGEIQATDDAIKSGLALAGIGLRVRIAMLPPGKDPNEVLSTEVVKAFYQAQPLSVTTATKIALKRRLMNRGA